MWYNTFNKKRNHRYGCHAIVKMYNSYRKLVFLTALMICISWSVIYNVPSKTFRRIKIIFKNDIYCYRNKSIASLPDILDEDPPKGRSIFFHETSCHSRELGKIFITTRQACAVESAALLNPNFNVYLLFTSPGTIKSEGSKSDKILHMLKQYKNIHLNHLDFESYVRGSPVEELYSSFKIESSLYARSHASDVLRYLTLWRYGGLYLDLDVVIIKSFEKLPPNFAGRESDEDVAAGVLSFDYGGDGHRWARQSLEDLKNNFDGYNWGNNGPGVITRLLQKLCEDIPVKNMNKERCKGFTVYPPSAFYPIPWRKWSYYFNSSHLKDVLNIINSSIAIHVWNKHSETEIVQIGSNVPYEYIAKKYCPKVHSASGSEF